MHKPIISSVIALALMGCGGGESGGGGGTPVPVKYFTIDFLGTKQAQSSDSNCQIFGYGAENNEGIKETVVAYRTTPDNTSTTQYEVFIHNGSGGVEKHFTSVDLKSNQLRLAQNTIPDDGYLSFAYFQAAGAITDVTTFAKAVLPDSFAIYAKGNINSCLTPSSANPQVQTVSGYIARPAGHIETLAGFNTPYQDLDDVTKYYKKDNGDTKPIEFPSQKKPLLAINYASTNNNIVSVIDFDFKNATDIGNKGEPLELNKVDYSNGHVELPKDLAIENALLFVNGKKLLSNANYAYLWQPLTQNTNGKFSYATSIGDENYYLYIKGQQVANNQTLHWGVQHVAQGTNNGALNADNILDEFPYQPEIKIENCQEAKIGQCITIDTGNLDAQSGIQRVLIDTTRQGNSSQFIRHVFYTPIIPNIPTLKFKRNGMNDTLDTEATTFISLLSTNVKTVQETFLYQHQYLYRMLRSDPSTDMIPLLKNIAAQQDQQDVLKRQPYTWVWLEQGTE